MKALIKSDAGADTLPADREHTVRAEDPQFSTSMSTNKVADLTPLIAGIAAFVHDDMRGARGEDRLPGGVRSLDCPDQLLGPEAEAVLVGKPADAANFRKAAQAAMRDAKPQSENGFKIELAKRCLAHALQIATMS